jgi:FkbM family methyltransferase
MLRFYSRFIHKGDLCFDVGAHMGNRTEIFLKLGAKVIAVEPQEDCINQLREKFNNEPRLTLVNKGLSDKEGGLTLYICEDATTISTFSDKWKTGRFSNYKWNTEKLIPVTTLDNLIKKFGLPVFCKIDVEGFEFQVLKGLSRPITYISFEFTREFFNDIEFCVNHLLSLGYVKFNCSLGESAKMFFQSWVTAKKLYQRLDLVDDSLLWGDIYAKFI